MLVSFIRLLALGALAATAAGAYLLDFHHDVTTGYALLLAGAVVIALLPERRVDSDGTVTHWLAGGLLIAVGAALNARVAASVAVYPDLQGATQTALWILGGLCLPLGFHFIDQRRPTPEPFLERADWWWIIGLSLAASLARIHHLNVGPPGLAPDEIWPLAQTLKVVRGENVNAFWTDFQGFNGVFHYVSALFVKTLGPLGFDAAHAAKLPGALAGGISVGMLYLAIRSVTNRRVAAAAGLFLVYQGTHWTLSRFYYQYAADLVWISASMALVLAGLRTERLSLLAAGGFTAAAGAIWLKTAIVAGPFASVLLLERLLTTRGRRAQALIAALVWGASFAVSSAPFVAQIWRDPNTFWHYREVARRRGLELGRLGMAAPEAYAAGLRQAIVALQNRDAVLSRHVVRSKRPILDVALSAMATVGLIWCISRFVASRSARVAILGLFVFLLPAVLSYPGDGDVSISRRMQGGFFFIAWIAAEGSAAVAQRALGPRLRFPFMLTIALSSMLLNFHAIRALYGRNMYLWYDEMGGNKALILPALREAAAGGPVFFRPTHFARGALAGATDLPNVVAVNDLTELRQKLSSSAGKRCTIVLPWDTSIDQNDSPAWVDGLADLVPPHMWQWGPPDPLGNPVYRIVRVRLPVEP